MRDGNPSPAVEGEFHRCALLPSGILESDSQRDLLNRLAPDVEPEDALPGISRDEEFQRVEGKTFEVGRPHYVKGDPVQISIGVSETDRPPCV